MNNIAIAIHGGAGTILRAAMPPDLEQRYLKILQQGVDVGHQLLANGGTSMEAVLKTVQFLEDEPLFNAGKGSVFTHSGSHEMDAAVMCGKTLGAGAVAGVSQVRNPVILADEIRLHSEHVLLSGEGAAAFARERNLAFETETYFFSDYRFGQWQEAQRTNTVTLDHTEDRKFGTVGAVALDAFGNLAAATSTGGMTNKKYNRVGDTPIIGAGTYANNLTCAVSCTGHGEYFMRAVVAYDVSCLMEYKGLTLQQACDQVVMNKLVKLGGEGGLIAVDPAGEVVLSFNSEGMYRASRRNYEPVFSQIYR